MKALQCSPLDEIFTHIDDSGKVRHFNASCAARSMPLLLGLGGAILVEAEMDPEFVAFIKERRGVEQRKVDRLKEPYLSLPLIGCYMKDGSVLTIDGHHRMVVLHSMGRTSYQIHLIDYGSWEQFLVEDMPEFLDGYCIEEVSRQLIGT